MQPSRRRRRSLLILVVAIAVTAVVVFATTTAQRRNRPDAAPRETTNPTGSQAPATTSPPGATTTTTFQFPTEYVGDVWVTVQSRDDQRQAVVLDWGSWRRTVDAPAEAAAVYRFRKSWDAPGTASPPIVASSPGDVELSFGYGNPPAGAIDANAGWIESPG